MITLRSYSLLSPPSWNKTSSNSPSMKELIDSGMMSEWEMNKNPHNFFLADDQR